MFSYITRRRSSWFQRTLCTFHCFFKGEVVKGVQRLKLPLFVGKSDSSPWLPSIFIKKSPKSQEKTPQGTSLSSPLFSSFSVCSVIAVSRFSVKAQILLSLTSKDHNSELKVLTEPQIFKVWREMSLY